MKRFFYIFCIVILWQCAADILKSQEYSGGTVYYFTLHPGNAKPQDTVAMLYLTSGVQSDVRIEKTGIPLRDNLSVSKDSVTVFGLKADEIQSTTTYNYNDLSDKPTERILENSALKLSFTGSDSSKLFIRSKYGKLSDGIQILDITKLGKNYGSHVIIGD